MRMTEKDLRDAGYEIVNMKITGADFYMEDYPEFKMTLSGDGLGCVFSSGCLGTGAIGDDSSSIAASVRGLEYIMRVMDVIGVAKISDFAGHYCRVAYKDFGDTVRIIGNIIYEDWFDSHYFWTKEKSI